MRRVVTLCLFVAFAVVFLAPSALAQRDPFDPLVNGEAAGTGTGTTGETAGGTDTTTGAIETQPFQENGADVLATTGAETEPWLVVALALLVLGGGSLALSRVLAAPVAPRERS